VVSQESLSPQWHFVAVGEQYGAARLSKANGMTSAADHQSIDIARTTATSEYFHLKCSEPVVF